MTDRVRLHLKDAQLRLLRCVWLVAQRALRMAWTRLARRYQLPRKLQDAHRQGLRRSDYGIFEGIENLPSTPAHRRGSLRYPTPARLRQRSRIDVVPDRRSWLRNR